MSTEQLTQEVMALPIREREELAQALWSSVYGERFPMKEEELVQECRRRSEELRSGAVEGHSLDEVRAAVRKALHCD